MLDRFEGRGTRIVCTVADEYERLALQRPAFEVIEGQMQSVIKSRGPFTRVASSALRSSFGSPVKAMESGSASHAR